ncbi:hypothetical protein [Streptomyces sp. NPDC047999]|uniref:hypothetical protein n=1 Tax=Streptomyces sp. NPDC047999 TaxID=3365497 RepID=UPI00371FEEF5
MTAAAMAVAAVAALAAGGLWWWAVLRLVVAPEHTGVLEGAVAASGWGLSLLPVHVASRRRAREAVRAPDRAGSPGTSR